MDENITPEGADAENQAAQIAAARAKWAEYREQDRVRRQRAERPEEQARVEELRAERRGQREREAAEAACERARTSRNYKAEEQLRRAEAGLPHDGHPLDPDWDRL